MTNLTLKGLLKVRKDTLRSQAEQERELSHLRYKSYRGIPTHNTSWVKEDVHGTFCYRGISYTK